MEREQCAVSNPVSERLIDLCALVHVVFQGRAKLEKLQSKFW
jgi:hypothetical protein